MDKSAKLILNTLRCPICRGQIDLISYMARRNPRPFNFCCANNHEHYGLWFIHWEQPPHIESERVIIYDNNFQYEIKVRHSLPVTVSGSSLTSPSTDIYVWEVDDENRVIDKVTPKVFSYDKCLFDFRNTNRDKILARIKTILVFQ